MTLCHSQCVPPPACGRQCELSAVAPDTCSHTSFHQHGPQPSGTVRLVNLLQIALVSYQSLVNSLMGTTLVARHHRGSRELLREVKPSRH